MVSGRDEAKPISLFYSYSHKDEELRNRLEDHLGGLRRRGLIEGWHDRRIGALPCSLFVLISRRRACHYIWQARTQRDKPYDMHGNVWEWVEDVWHDNYKGAPDDGSAWSTGRDNNLRVLRGGSWTCTSGALRSEHRYKAKLDRRDDTVGFWVARTL